MSITTATATDPPLHLLQKFCHFFLSEDGGASKVEVTTRELKFPTCSCSARGLTCTLSRKVLNASKWIQMAVFVQGHHQHRHGSVVRLMIARSREAAPCSEVTATRLVVNRVCGLIAPDTPVPLAVKNGDTLGLNVGSITSSLV